MGQIYKITNKINGKIYIGKTTGTTQKRWKEHCYPSHLEDGTHFHRAILKYGSDNFIVETIEDNIPSDIINDREKYWISFYNSYNDGYNETLGGDGTTKFTPENILEAFHRNNNNEIATTQELGCCIQVINNALSDVGIDFRQRIEYSHADIVNKYQEIKNVNQTAEQLNINRQTVLRAIKEHHINTGYKKAVYQIDKDTNEIINLFESQHEAARFLFNKTDPAKNISAACRGKIKSAYGYKWAFANDM